jgi:WD40 repeat protein
VLAHPALVSALAFGPDGRTLATATSRDPSKVGSPPEVVRLWDLTTRTERDTLPVASIRDIAFAPDGKAVALASNDTTARVYIPGSPPRLRFPPLVHRSQASQVGFTPGGEVLMTASGSVTYLWDAAAGTALAPHRREAGQSALSPDGRVLATGSLDGPVRLWDVNAGSARPFRFRHGDLIRAAAFSPDGSLAVTADQAGVARMWTTADGKAHGREMRHTPDGKASPQDAGNKDRQATRLSSVIEAVLFTPDGRTLVTAGWDKTARLWNVADGTPLGSPLVHPDAVHCLAVTAGGRTLMTGGNDGGVRLWDATTGAQLGDVLRHTGSVRRMAVSGDGRFLAAAGFGASVSLWDLSSRTALPPIKHEGRSGVGVVAFSPNNPWLLTTFDKSAFLWDTQTLSLIARCDGHDRGIEAAAFFPDGRTLLTGSWDGTARLWEVPSGKPLGRRSHDGAVTAVAVSPDGRMIVTGCQDNAARLWSAATLRPLGPPIRHRGEVSVASFSPDSQAVLSASGTAQLMRLAAVEAPAEDLGTLVEVWTGTSLAEDGTLALLSPDRWKALRGQVRDPGPRVVWPLSALRDAHLGDSGPFGRSHLSGR